MAQPQHILAVSGCVGPCRRRYRYSITDGGRDFIDGFRIRLPIFGNIWISTRWRCFRARFPRCSPAACRWFRRWRRRRAPSLRADIEGVFSSIVTVREGKSLADSLGRTGVIPGLAAEMITVGEQTGALPQMLNSVAEFFEEDVATALTAALRSSSRPSSSSWRGGGLHSHLALPAIFSLDRLPGSGVNRHGRHASHHASASQRSLPGGQDERARLKPWRTAITPSSSI